MMPKFMFVFLALIATTIGGNAIKDDNEALINEEDVAKTTENETTTSHLLDGSPEDNETYAEAHHGQEITKREDLLLDLVRDKVEEEGPQTELSRIIVNDDDASPTAMADIYNGKIHYYILERDPNGIIRKFEVRQVDEHWRPIRDVSSNPLPYQNSMVPLEQAPTGPQFKSFYGQPQYPPSYSYGGGDPYGYQPYTYAQSFGPNGFQPITKSENKVYSKQSKGGYSFYQPPAPKMKFNRWTGPTYSVNNEDTKSSIDYNLLGKLSGKGSAGIKGAFSDWGVNKYGNQDRFTASGGSKSQVNKNRYNAASGPGVQGYSGGGTGGFRGQSNVNAGPGGYGRGNAGSSAYGQTYGRVNRPYGRRYGRSSY